MLVKFRSPATESITMFGEHAKPLLEAMGTRGNIPGALSGADVASALERLEMAMEQVKAATYAETAARPADNEDAAADDDDDDEPRNVSLATRAIPLLSLMKRAAAADAAVMWEPA